MSGAFLAPGRRDRLASEVVGGLGLVALAVGLAVLAGSDRLGFDLGGAIAGIASQLAITLPADALVLVASGLELAAGLVLARALRRTPFDSLLEAALAAAVAEVLKGAFLVGLLGASGLFRGPLLTAIDLVIVIGWLWAHARLGSRVALVADWRARVPSWRSLPALSLAVLVAIVWAGPVLLQLASPVVPFIDVLPNYVGPAEHLRTFGILSPLSAIQSPIIGPSRYASGYEGWLGSIAAMTGLPAVLAASAFVLPTGALVATGVQRLANVVAGPGRSTGPWALLAFAVTESFARLADARGTVVVLPLVFLALSLAVGSSSRATVDRPTSWRVSDGVAIGLALGAAILVHPVIGAFATATVVLLAVIQPERLAVTATVAAATAGLIAMLQLAVMLGAPVPPLLLPGWLVAGGLVGVALARLVEARPLVAAALAWLARWARIGLIALAMVGLGFAVRAGAVDLAKVPTALASGWDLVLEGCGVLLAAVVLGWLLGSSSARSPLLLATVLVGLAADVGSQLVPGNLGFLADAIRFEVPKTVHYWLPVFVAVVAGPVLAGASTAGRLPWLARAGAVGAIVIVAALPLRTEPIDALHLGEHRLSESLAIDLRWAGTGFWVGFPDSRRLVDAPRQEILDAVRAEIDAGRLHADSPVLHVARSFQEWVSTPLGVFDGVAETFVSPDREVSHQTVGGRLFGMESLAGFLASGAYPYVVLEPGGLPDAASIRSSILAAGYRSIFANGQGELFALA